MVFEIHLDMLDNLTWLFSTDTNFSHISNVSNDVYKILMTL